MLNKIVWLVLVLLLICGLKCFAQSEVIQIYGTPTTEERAASEAYFRERRSINAAYVKEQVTRQHVKDVEVLKFANALLLESAGAAKVNVNVSTSVSNKLKAEQAVRQSA